MSGKLEISDLEGKNLIYLLISKEVNAKEIDKDNLLSLKPFST